MMETYSMVNFDTTCKVRLSFMCQVEPGGAVVSKILYLAPLINLTIRVLGSKTDRESIALATR